ncbi:MAG: hypothetical protein ABI779_00515 [Acidobacteriota bacterium]
MDDGAFEATGTSRPEDAPGRVSGRAAVPWLILIALAAVWIAALLHRGQPLAWDELEFFRATRWTGQGRVPFRDFWEHHTPLQWIVFAPVARLFGGGPGAGAVVAMRWAQIALWVPMLLLVMRLSRGPGRWWALGFLLVSPLFIRSALEYRVDVLGNLGYFAALACAVKRRWIAFGAAMSLAVLANMRLAPLVVITTLIVLFWDGRNRRWSFQRSAMRLVSGVVLVAVPFIGWLFLTRAWRPFLDGVVGYNTASATLLEVNTWYQFAAPIWQRDPAAILLWAAALAGVVIALRELRRPDTPQILALLFLASLATIAAMEVQYEYHFQGPYLLMVPLAAVALARLERWRTAAVAMAAGSLVLAVVPLVAEPFGGAMRYQDFVMREVDRRTGPDARVFDGNGYALRREPAYRYWFLTTGVRFLAGRGAIAPYDIAANPPAAVIYNLRMQRWFEIFPKTAAYAVHHYVPLTRDLWVPGLTAIAQPGRAVTWVAPASGRYTLWPSAALLRHPWLTRPLDYAAVQGPRATQYAIPLRRLPLSSTLQWSVDGLPLTGRDAELKKGSRITLVSSGPGPIGVLLVPADLTTLCLAPGEEFQF